MVIESKIFIIALIATGDRQEINAGHRSTCFSCSKIGSLLGVSSELKSYFLIEKFRIYKTRKKRNQKTEYHPV